VQSSEYPVHLAYGHGMLAGTAGPEPVSLQITPGVVFGGVGEVIVDATWQSTSNYLLDPGEAVEAEANGTFGEEELHLTGRFYLGRVYRGRLFPFLFRDGSVEGRVGERQIAVRIEAAADGLSTSTVRAEGSWGDTSISLHGSVGISRGREGWIRGKVGNDTVDLLVGNADAGLTIEGEFSGAVDLLIVVTACLLMFLGAMWRD
jgi:hypothetical protein